MLSELKNSPRVVGVKQLRKALGRDEIRRVFLADDADPDHLIAVGAAILVAGFMGGCLNQWLKQVSSRPRYKYPRR